MRTLSLVLHIKKNNSYTIHKAIPSFLSYKDKCSDYNVLINKRFYEKFNTFGGNYAKNRFISKKKYQMNIEASIQTLLPILGNTVLWISIIGVIFVIIMENKNPLKTISWVVVIYFLPFAGLILYFFFGQDIRKKRMISKRIDHQVKDRMFEKFDSSELDRIEGKAHHLIRLLQGNNHALPFAGNKIKIYTTGEEKMAELFEAIEKAIHHVHLQYFKIEDDQIGNQLLDLLARKAKEGVKVRVIYDDAACWKVDKEFYERMKEEGIEVRGFLKVRFPIFANKINYRNHRKVVVIDGYTGFIGGMNIADRYIHGLKWGNWRDTHMKITGRAVYGLQSSFLLDWFFVDQTLVSSRDYFPEIGDYGDVTIQIATSGPTDHWHNIMQAILFALTNAKEYIYIQTPYFLPTDSIMQAFKACALADVDIRLMLPEDADVPMVRSASRSFLKEIMEAGVKVYFYKKGFLHSKAIVWDDYFSTIGSTNIDFRSFEHNFEINAFMYDENTAKDLKRIFLTDQQDSIRIRLKEWIKRPLTERCKESFCRLFSPML